MIAGLMLPERKRVCRAIHFEAPDRVPIRHSAMAAALYEHGAKLQQLCKQIPGDFGDYSDAPLPAPDPKDIRPDGSYYRLETNAWGVEWEYIQFGIVGHPKTRPLDDWANLRGYQAPAPPALSGPEFEKACAAAKAHKQHAYLLGGWVNLFEVMHAVRRFEDVLCDVMDDSPEINQLADLITAHQLAVIQYLIATGHDGVMLADDWGTQSGLLLSPQVWRRFFRPRYLRLTEALKKARVHIFFHSCGHTLPLLDDLAELGIDVLWPQLSSNDNRQLAEKCRERKLCLELHMDRQQLMTFGTPAQIDAAVAQARRTFGTPQGGIIYHAEVDNGFPFANVEALLRAFQRYS